MKIGQPIPAVTVDAYFQDEFSKLNLSSFKGKWLVMLFYPADFSFVCPTELADAADHYAEFQKLSAEIVSLSTDSKYVHKAWHDQSPLVKKVQYPMLADPTGVVCQAFDTYVAGSGQSIRSTYLIDPDQNVTAYEMHTNAIGRNILEIKRKLEAAAYIRANGPSMLCPAGWQPGKKTLTDSIDMVGKL